MRPLLPRFFLGSKLVFSGALLAAVCLLGACDGHSDKEAPEGYGHGSSHSDSYHTHQIDSHPDSSSFSDTRGTDAGETQAGNGEQAAPAASPGPSQPGRFFPSGS